jgi:hypothetical protein
MTLQEYYIKEIQLKHQYREGQMRNKLNFIDDNKKYDEGNILKSQRSGEYFFVDSIDLRKTPLGFPNKLGIYYSGRVVDKNTLEIVTPEIEFGEFQSAVIKIK